MSLIRRKDPGQAWETEVDSDSGGPTQPFQTVEGETLPIVETSEDFPLLAWDDVEGQFDLNNGRIANGHFQTVDGATLSGNGVFAQTVTVVDDITNPTVFTQILAGTADPTADGGIDRNVGSMYLRKNGTTGELWVKTGTADNAWTQVT